MTIRQFRRLAPIARHSRRPALKLLANVKRRVKLKRRLVAYADLDQQ
jgi:hypothetical protein